MPTEKPIEFQPFTIINATDEPVTVCASWWETWAVDPDGKMHVVMSDTRATVVTVARFDLARWADDGGRAP